MMLLLRRVTGRVSDDRLRPKRPAPRREGEQFPTVGGGGADRGGAVAALGLLAARAAREGWPRRVVDLAAVRSVRPTITAMSSQTVVGSRDCFEDAGMVRHEPPAMVAIGRGHRRASRARGVHVRGGHGELLRLISGT